MQKELFENIYPLKAKSLAIRKHPKQQLSKNQEAFNKLTQKIEKLQKDIEKKQLEFDLALKMYGSEVHPAVLRMLENRSKLIIALWNIYEPGKLSKTDQRHLKNILKYHLQEYFSQSATEPDEALQNIFSKIEGVSYEKMMQEQKEDIEAEMYAAFSNLGVDLDGVDMADIASVEEKLAEARGKMAEMEQLEDERRKQRQQNKKKSLKQLNSEKLEQAAAEMKQKNIGTIYKQLAKLFHPDLEQDAARRIEKEALMKELTAAYEAKNLHALLSLELKWIHKENDHLESLTEEKLAVYLQILKEQARDLEYEKNNIFQQPQYAVLANEFGYDIQRFPAETVRLYLKSTNKVADNFKRDTSDFESDMAHRNVKEMIKQWKQREKEYSEDDILDMLFR